MLVPQQVQIQTVDFCNRRCVFCPNSLMQKSADTLMPMPVFDKVLSDLHSIGFAGRLHLYLMGEPLCDPRILPLIKRTRAVFPKNGIFISTNGDGLKSVEDIERLFDAGLSELAISHYDDSNEHLKQCRDERVIHADLNQLRHTFYNRAGMVKVGCVVPQPRCSWLWSKAYINWRGDVILCCSDYHYEVVFGNVLDSDFVSIFNTEGYSAYREAHAAGRGKEMMLCRDCNRISPGGKALIAAALSRGGPGTQIGDSCR